MNFCVNAIQLRRALEEIEAAEANGFHHCLAVFRLSAVGMMLSDNLADYSDMIERGHGTDGRLDWGRFQGVTRRNRLVDGKLVPIESSAAHIPKMPNQIPKTKTGHKPKHATR